MKQTVVLIGLMGAGKSRTGIELARLLHLPFFDSDREIEQAAGLSIPDIFENYGEKEFRTVEKKVLRRLLSGDPKVIATGGGAFLQPEIRTMIGNKATSVWLKARLETMLERTSRTDRRPLLRGVDKKEKLQELINARYTVYATADIAVDTDDRHPKETAKNIAALLAQHGKSNKS